MYTWIWNHLPGTVVLRVLQSLALVSAISLLLLFVVFPAVEPHLPPNPITGTVTVNQ